MPRGQSNMDYTRIYGAKSPEEPSGNAVGHAVKYKAESRFTHVLTTSTTETIIITGRTINRI